LKRFEICFKIPSFTIKRIKEISRTKKGEEEYLQFESMYYIDGQPTIPFLEYLISQILGNLEIMEKKLRSGEEMTIFGCDDPIDLVLKPKNRKEYEITVFDERHPEKKFKTVEEKAKILDEFLATGKKIVEELRKIEPNITNTLAIRKMQETINKIEETRGAE